MVRRFQLNKLVRDGVFADMEACGQLPKHRILGDDQEFEAALRAKYAEERAEFDPDSPKAIDELADQAEVIAHLEAYSDVGELLVLLEQQLRRCGASVAELTAVQAGKRERVGGFAGRIFVEFVAVSEDDPWADYYSQHPATFPEIGADVL